jgi:hypothetical protein
MEKFSKLLESKDTFDPDILKYIDNISNIIIEDNMNIYLGDILLLQDNNTITENQYIEFEDLIQEVYEGEVSVDELVELAKKYNVLKQITNSYVFESLYIKDWVNKSAKISDIMKKINK